MNTDEWQGRLEETFSWKGVVGGQLTEMFACEQACGEHLARTFHGQAVLMDSFQSFLICTINEVKRLVGTHGWPKDRSHYSATVFYFIKMLRGVRACEILLMHGYAADGYALLRDLKDRVVFLAALAHNVTTWEALSGHGDEVPVPVGRRLTQDEAECMRKKAWKEENRILSLTLRENSGLNERALRVLGKWEKLFNKEIHGSKLSFFNELGNASRGDMPLSVGPVVEDEMTYMYMSRASEIGWLITRLLPYLQPVAHAFGETWEMKWQILDESFLHVQHGLSRIGKDIGDVFIEFVNSKFRFPEPFLYSEPNGTGNATP